MSNQAIKQNNFQKELALNATSPKESKAKIPKVGDQASLSAFNFVLGNGKDHTPIIDKVEEWIENLEEKIENFEEQKQQEQQASNLSSANSTSASIASSQMNTYLEDLKKKEQEENEERRRKNDELRTAVKNSLITSLKSISQNQDVLDYLDKLTVNYQSAAMVCEEVPEGSEGPIEDTETADTQAQNTTDMQDVFDFQGLICQLDSTAMQALADQAQNQVEMNNAMLEVAHQEYLDTENQINEQEKKKKHHSFWGFCKSVFKVVLSPVELAGASLATAVTGNAKYVKNEAESVKDAVKTVAVDTKDLGLLAVELVGAVAAVSAFDMKGAKKLWNDVEENPSLQLAIELCAIALTAATGGAAGLAMMAAITALSQVKIPGTDKTCMEELAEGCAKAAYGIASLFSSDVSMDNCKLAGDILAVAIVACLTGGVGAAKYGATMGFSAAAMALGTGLSVMAPDIVEDAGLTGKAAMGLEIALEVAGLALNIAGIVGIASSTATREAEAGQKALKDLEDKAAEAATSADEASAAVDTAEGVEAIEKAQQQAEVAKLASQQAQKDLEAAQEKQLELGRSKFGTEAKALAFTDGVLNILNGIKTIDLGKIQEKILDLQADLRQTNGGISRGDQNLKGITDNMSSVNDQFSQIIKDFGKIAQPWQTTAEILA